MSITEIVSGLVVEGKISELEGITIVTAVIQLAKEQRPDVLRQVGAAPVRTAKDLCSKA